MTTRTKTLYFCSLSAAVLLFSMCNNTQGLLLGDYGSFYRVNSLSLGLISALQSMGMLLSMLALMLGAIKIRKPVMLLVSAGAVAAVLLTLSATPAYGILCGLYLLLGASYGQIDSIGSALTADLYREGAQAKSRMGIIHGCIGIGGIAGSALVGQCKRAHMPFDDILLLFGLIALLVLVYSLFAFAGAHRHLSAVTTVDKPQHFRENLGLFTAPNCLLLLAIAFYGGHQTCLIFWAAQYVEGALSTAALAPVSVTLFWCGTVVSRFLAPRLPVKTEHYIGISALLTALVLAIALVWGNAAVFCGSVLAAGLLSGGVIPMGIHCLCQRYQKNVLFATSVTLVMLYALQMLSALVSGGVSAGHFPGGGMGVSALCAALSGATALVAATYAKAGK